MATRVLLGAVGLFFLAIIILGVSILVSDSSQEATDQPVGPDGTTTTQQQEATTTSEPEPEPPNPAFSSTFGPACDQFPTAGPGSLEAMSNESSIAAMSTNSLMSTMAGLAEASDFGGLFDDRTVFVPSNAALEGHTYLEEWQSGERDIALDLINTLQENLVDAQELIAAGRSTPLAGSGVKVTTEGDIMMVGQATVLCGNIETNSGILFLIDTAVI